jgi:hypothetical protein
VTARLALIPAGSWPRRMGPDLAAGYVGESTVDGFLQRVRKGALSHKSLRLPRSEQVQLPKNFRFEGRWTDKTR